MQTITPCLLRPDDDLHPPVKLLLSDGPIAWDNQPAFAVALSLDSIRVDTHVLHQPVFYSLGSPLAKNKIVKIAAEGIGVPLDLENRLRVPLNEAA
jgi:hypothetical protein